MTTRINNLITRVYHADCLHYRGQQPQLTFRKHETILYRSRIHAKSDLVDKLKIAYTDCGFRDGLQIGF